MCNLPNALLKVQQKRFVSTKQCAPPLLEEEQNEDEEKEEEKQKRRKDREAP